MMNNLAEEIQKLGMTMKDPATDMTKNIVDELKNALSSMMGNFKETISGNTKYEMENLAAILGAASSTLIDFPNKVEMLSKSMASNIIDTKNIFEQISFNAISQSKNSSEEMSKQMNLTADLFKNKILDIQLGQETLIKRQNESIEMTRQAIEDIGKNSVNQTSESLENSKKHFELISNMLSSAVSNMHSSQEKLLNRQSEGAKSSESLLASFNNMLSKLEASLAKADGSFSQFFSVYSELKMLSVSMGKTNEIIVGSGEIFKNAQNDFSTKFKDLMANNIFTIKEIEKILQQAKELSENYAEKFEIIENGLQGIFSEIQSGLDEYTKTINRGVSDNLSQFSTKFTTMAESLNGSINMQKDILEELSEQFEKIRR